MRERRGEKRGEGDRKERGGEDDDDGDGKRSSIGIHTPLRLRYINDKDRKTEVINDGKREKTVRHACLAMNSFIPLFLPFSGHLRDFCGDLPFA